MIRAEFDGDDVLVPDDMGNRHRQMIAEWEFDEEGNRVNTIPPYVAPPAPVPPIPRLGFWLAAAEIGVTKAGVKAHIDAMPEGVEKQQAIVYFEDAQNYRRTDPLLNQMAEVENITQSQLDDLWTWALANYA
ncbi:hypothetical protein N5C66_05765 [Rhizobium pusense]|uniref:hypothetical protein n=1 Tax=Agrobacterium pusense TaxID=648995 RepID=UPI002448B269|nr:hypothetical protein [Agrobacterium pusense]MDH1097404.1 hypothetical protein [Agrobacterium pusense]MDH1111234.1 hypothetical protein [Agrobacterium pusense]MDH2193437.1 hypothetical protein [Agrobacterium pusense]